MNENETTETMAAEPEEVTEAEAAKGKKQSWSGKLSPDTLRDLRAVIDQHRDADEALKTLIFHYNAAEAAERKDESLLHTQARRAYALHADAIARLIDEAYVSGTEQVEIVRHEYEGSGGKLTVALKYNATLQQQLTTMTAERDAAIAEAVTAQEQARDADARATAAETRATEAETRAQAIDDLRRTIGEALANASRRAEAAEARAQEADRRAAEARTQAATAQAAQAAAEAKAQAAEARATEADKAAAEAAARAEEANKAAATSDARAQAAEAARAEAETRAEEAEKRAAGAINGVQQLVTAIKAAPSWPGDVNLTALFAPKTTTTDEDKEDKEEK